MFNAALYTIAKTWKQSKCPSTDDGLRRYGTYTQWNTLGNKKEQNNAICSNMGATGDSHTK